ncbi:ORF6N domain-containing protein [Gluconobacter cerinus]|uniref:ORF6N domain-containing protein n=1 Tax=Gluconobacter cerinus TaxID=38307 RepID=UPI003AB673BF
MTQVTINDRAVDVIEYADQRVVTLGMVDALHERPQGTARRNFNSNKSHLIEGEDYISVCADEIRTRKLMDLSPKAQSDITLLTESGYLMLVKSFTDDLAWSVQRQLVKQYFGSGVGGPIRVKSAPQPKLAGMGRTFTDMRRIAKLMKLDDAQAAIHASHAVERLHGVNPLEVMNIRRIESPAQKPFFTVSDLAKREGWQSAQWLNRTLLAMGLQDKSGSDDNPWTATEAGQTYSRLEDAPIKGRRSKQMLLWSAEIIPLVKQHITQSATPYAAITAAEDPALVGEGTVT